MKNLTRVMAALMCGAIVASAGSVTTFAATTGHITSGHIADPTGVTAQHRSVKIAPTKHGKIEVEGVYDGLAACGSRLYVKLIPDAGYVAQLNNRNQYFTTNNDVDWQGIRKEADGTYSFLMPWCDPKIGITLDATFVPAGQANVTPAPASVTPAPSNVTPAPANVTPAPENDNVVISDGKKGIPMSVVQPAHGKIVVSCKDNLPGTVVTVKLIPDAGYVAKENARHQYFTTNNDVDWQGITKVTENVYTFNMPWADPNVGIRIEAEFVPAK